MNETCPPCDQGLDCEDQAFEILQRLRDTREENERLSAENSHMLEALQKMAKTMYELTGSKVPAASVLGMVQYALKPSVDAARASTLQEQPK